MVSHQAIGVVSPSIASGDLAQDIEKSRAVLVVVKDGFLAIAAGSNVLERAGIFYAQRAGHTGPYDTIRCDSILDPINDPW